MPVLVSKCVMGYNCRYDGKNQKQDILLKDQSLKQLQYQQLIEFLPFCAEDVVLGTPRHSSAFYTTEKGIRVLFNDTKEDVTDKFQLGAQKCLQFCNENGIFYAVMKHKSPSCGYGYVHLDDGFGEMNGVTTQLLLDNDFIIQRSEK